jgi:hypothetical protein
LTLFYTELLRRPYGFFYKEERPRAVLFTYSIVPRGRGDAQALARGNLYAPNSDAAKRYAQTANLHNDRGRKDLEVILTDDRGTEIWRGPYNG